ncbi:MAG: AAA ATPase domain protein [uncultured archaeon A07HR60]|nr:MAG: AAA ATPase domain protein [uncultured archaeon A07HR60]
MELESLRVENFRSIADSGWVAIDDLTCFIGKNESGKTAFMQAVEKLNPSHETDEYSPYEDYPRDKWPSYSDRHDTDPDNVVTARFQLDEDDVSAIETTCGRGLIDGREMTVSRDYQNTLTWTLELDESACQEYLLGEYGSELPEELETALSDVSSLSGLRDGEEYAELEADLGDDPVTVVANDIGDAVLEDRLPLFHRIGEYTLMNGTIDIESLMQRREDETLSPGDRAFLSLLTVADLELAEFLEVDDWRQKTTQLEAASASVSSEAMQYWNQSGSIRVRIDSASSDDDEDRRLLAIRVENLDSNITVRFEGRSRGFRSFFSTFCQLAELRQRDDDIHIMLDEPALHLHARAKEEFLAFLKDDLSAKQPVLYTTHSPFMIDDDNLHQVKMVDSDPAREMNVFEDVSLADDRTRFPLRNVFELDLMDTLSVRPQTLLVERKADRIYLDFVSRALKNDGDSGLDDRWTVIPISNAENIQSFVSLFGEDNLELAALLSDRPKRRRRSSSDQPGSEAGDFEIRYISDYSPVDGGSLEDLFSDEFYLQLVSRAYADSLATAPRTPDVLSPADLSASTAKEPIPSRVQQYFERDEIEVTFDRAAPALFLLENRQELVDQLDQQSQQQFFPLLKEFNNIVKSLDSTVKKRSSLIDTLGL